MPDSTWRAAWATESVATPETTRVAQMGKIFGYTKGLHAVHLISVGVRLRLFHTLRDAQPGLTADSLASKHGLNAQYVRVWCEAACALELLDYQPGTGFRLAPFMDELLAQPEGTYYLGAIPEVHLSMSRDYDRYPVLFQTGGTFPYQEHDAVFLTGVAAATRSLPRMFLDAVVPKLPGLRARLDGGASILDVGCGGGGAIVEFASRFPKVRCVGLDVEANSIRMAQELIRGRGLEGRVQARLVTGDAWPADLAGAFDLVTTFLVLHEIRPELKGSVIAQCVRALRPGGQLLIFDERYPSGPAELRDPAQIYAVMAQWYELTWGNVVNTREEIQRLLAEHGLNIVDETALSRFYIVTAER
jgi:SAM-dependent methyltransferase